MSKKQEILEAYYDELVPVSDDVMTHPICLFLDGHPDQFIRELLPRFERFLIVEAICRPTNSIYHELFRDCTLNDVREELGTFRLMVLEDFLTKQGIK